MAVLDTLIKKMTLNDQEDEYYDDELEKVEENDIEINKDVDYSIVWRQSTK